MPTIQERYEATKKIQVAANEMRELIEAYVRGTARVDGERTVTLTPEQKQVLLDEYLQHRAALLGAAPNV